jgi:hypothetical protein
MCVQQTTSKRSLCDVAQKFRWFKMFEAALNFLRTNNTGVCNRTGKLFGELIQHFVIGGVEACLRADDHGDLRIIGAVGIKKHEKRVAIHKCNPQWYILELLDGFGSHTDSLEANKLCAKYKVLSLKEVADSSHINQA